MYPSTPSHPARARSGDPPVLAVGDVGASLQGWNLEGKDTWIGATDAAAFLRFLGFDAVLLDFSSPEAQSARTEALQVLGQLQAARSAGQATVAANLESSLHALWVHAGCAPPRLSPLGHALQRLICAPCGCRCCGSASGWVYLGACVPVPCSE